eukprot:TRINITY_DN23809_c0_g1_i1.p1 TRINITY_DN23809_c0_g1~~TRINITY_DN23809_c0_g1_i1.p1  ORF type:complete len:353 (+),score=70.96 TRINITY_DN23809_c0_g1_i1:146-1204(+)
MDAANLCLRNAYAASPLSHLDASPLSSVRSTVTNSRLHKSKPCLSNGHSRARVEECSMILDHLRVTDGEFGKVPTNRSFHLSRSHRSDQSLSSKASQLYKGRDQRGVATMAGKSSTGSSYPAPKRQKKEEVEEEEDSDFMFDEGTEEEIDSYVQMQFQSDLGLPKPKHYEIVFLVHEDHFEEMPAIIQKVKDKILNEFKGNIWRLNDWGLRRLAYKIKKARKANYVLLNIEVSAAQIREFDTMLRTDERIIRYLTFSKKAAEIEDYPPPPEWGSSCVEGEEDEWGDDEDEDDEENEDEPASKPSARAQARRVTIGSPAGKSKLVSEDGNLLIEVEGKAPTPKRLTLDTRQKG